MFVVVTFDKSKRREVNRLIELPCPSHCGPVHLRPCFLLWYCHLLIATGACDDAFPLVYCNITCNLFLFCLPTVESLEPVGPVKDVE
jgi:hypothetical protein